MHGVAWLFTGCPRPFHYPCPQVCFFFYWEDVAILILIVSSFDLPDDVFQPGEVRPKKPMKKVVKKNVDIAGQKRNNTELDVSQRKRVKGT